MKELLLAFVGSLFPGILFNVRKGNLIWVGVCGAIGWGVFDGLSNITGETVFPAFLGAVIVGVYSEAMARILKIPATVFSISGIFPLVPGIAAYNTIQYIVESRLSEAASKGIETLSAAAAIAFGIMLVSTIFRIGRKLKKRGTEGQVPCPK